MTRPPERNRRTAVVRKSNPALPESRVPRTPRPPWRARGLAWREQHLYSFFSSLGRLAARPWATALTVLVLGFALALPLLFFLVFDNARALSGGLREAREVTVFLKPALDGKAASAMATQMRSRSDVIDVTTRTPEQGLAEFRELSGFRDALDVLRSNPLPSVLVITPRPGTDMDNPALVVQLRTDERVDLVQYDAAWRRRLSDILQLAERVVAVIAALLALATLLVIGNTVRMDIQARSEEISVMQLIGASNGFVRRPFLYTGLWYGLLGSALALLIVGVVELALAAPTARLLDSYANRFALHGIDVAVAGVVVVSSALLGWLGAFFASARHLAIGQPRE